MKHTTSRWVILGFTALAVISVCALTGCGSSGPAKPAQKQTGVTGTASATGVPLSMSASTADATPWKYHTENRLKYAEARQALVKELKAKSDPEFLRLRNEVQNTKRAAYDAVMKRYPDIAKITNPAIQHRQAWKRVRELSKTGEPTATAFMKSRDQLENYLCTKNPALKALRDSMQGDVDE